MKIAKRGRLLKLLVFLSIAGVIGYGIQVWQQYQADEKLRISYTAFVDKVNAGEIVNTNT